MTVFGRIKIGNEIWYLDKVVLNLTNWIDGKYAAGKYAAHSRYTTMFCNFS
jgi:hypothetical protein